MIKNLFSCSVCIRVFFIAVSVIIVSMLVAQSRLITLASIFLILLYYFYLTEKTNFQQSC